MSFESEDEDAVVAAGIGSGLAQRIEEPVDAVAGPQVQRDLVGQHVAHVVEHVQVPPGK
jgi:hypothetical protein